MKGRRAVTFGRVHVDARSHQRLHRRDIPSLHRIDQSFVGERRSQAIAAAAIVTMTASAAIRASIVAGWRSQRDRSGADAEARNIHAEPMRERQQQVRQRRLLRRDDVTASRQRDGHRRSQSEAEKARGCFRRPCRCRRESSNGPATCRRRPASSASAPGTCRTAARGRC